MSHDRTHLLAENTLEVTAINSDSNYERVCVELCRAAVLHCGHISIL